MDWAAVIDRLRPGAGWGLAGSYEELATTWRDTTQTLPTEAEMRAAWDDVRRAELKDSVARAASQAHAALSMAELMALLGRYITATECVGAASPRPSDWPLQAALIGVRVTPSGDDGADLKAAAAIQIADVVKWATVAAEPAVISEAALAAIDTATLLDDAEVAADNALSAVEDARLRAASLRAAGKPEGAGRVEAPEAPAIGGPGERGA